MDGNLPYLHVNSWNKTLFEHVQVKFYPKNDLREIPPVPAPHSFWAVKKDKFRSFSADIYLKTIRENVVVSNKMSNTLGASGMIAALKNFMFSQTLAF